MSFVHYFYTFFVFILVICEQIISLENRLYFNNHFNQNLNVNLVKDTTVHAESGRQIIVTIPPDKPLSKFIYNCSLPHILPYRFNIDKAELCHSIGVGEYENCYNVVNVYSIEIGKKHFQIKFNTSSGFLVSTNSDWQQFEEGFYFCRLQNKYETLQSNIFKIEVNGTDNEALEKKIKRYLRPQAIPEIIKQRKILDCGLPTSPRDSVLRCASFIDSVDWVACDSKGFQISRCLKNPNERIKIEINKDYYQFCNSSIALSDQYYQNHKSSVVVCVVKNVGIYSQFIIDSDQNPSLKNAYVVQKDPLVSEVQFEEQFNAIGNKLTAIYDGKVRNYHWKKDDFDMLKDYMVSSHELIFPRRMMPFHEGKYTLTVTLDNNQNLHFVFEVKVIGAPKLMNEKLHHNIVYVMEGSSKSLEVAIEGIKLNTSIEVNHQEICIKSSRTILEGISNIKNVFSYLKDYQLSLRVVGHPSHTTIYYGITAPPFQHGYLGGYHTLDVVARNDVGETRVRFIIQTMEKPQWRMTPGELPYDSNCAMNNPPYYRCSVYSERYREIGIHVKQEWKINGDNITEFYRRNNWPIDFTERNDLLIFSRGSRTEDILIDNMTLSCSINLLSPRSEGDGSSPCYMLYTSDHDPSITRNLNTKFVRVKVDFFNQKEKLLKIIWWTFLSFILVISTAIAAVLFSCSGDIPSQYRSKESVLGLPGSDNAPSTNYGRNHLDMSEISSVYNAIVGASDRWKHSKDLDSEVDCSDEANNQFYIDSKFGCSTFGHPSMVSSKSRSIRDNSRA